jgi:argininosuccinate lyase
VNRRALSRAAASGHLVATELADYLVSRGIPFREAHHITGQIVRHCLDRHQEIQDLSLSELRAFSPAFEKDVMDVITLEGAIERKAQIGGTARKCVEARIKTLHKALGTT